MRRLISSAVSLITSAILALSASALAYSADISPNLPDISSVTANYKEGGYNYGYFLDENNAEVYKAFIKLIEPSTSRFTVTLPNPVSVKLSTYPNDFSDEDEKTFQQAVFQNCKPAIDSALWDIPEIIWLEPSQMQIGIGDYDIGRVNIFTGEYTLTINELAFVPALTSGYSSVSEAKEYYEKLRTSVAKFPVEGETRYEKLLSVHDNIIKFTNYDAESRFPDSAIGAMVEPGVVCEGYAKAFKLMCDELGIPCVIIFGNFNSETKIGHVWNYVQMEDENWYAVDVTWDDTDGANGIELKHQYFLKGSKSFFTNHTPINDYNITVFTYPEISVNDYDPDKIVTPPETTTLSTSTTTVSSASSTDTTTTTTTATSTTTSSATSTTSSTTTSTITSTITSTTTSTTSSTTTSTTSSTTTVTTTTPPVPEYETGDLNHDGEVNAADLVLCAKVVMGAVQPKYSCDVNGDGSTDIFDVVFMRKLICKILSS